MEWSAMWEDPQTPELSPLHPYSRTPASLSTSSKQSTAGAVDAQVIKVTSATTCGTVDRIIKAQWPANSTNQKKT